MTSQKTSGQFWKLIAVFAIAHWFLLVVSGTLTLIGMRRLDHPELPVTTIERVCGVIVSVLQEPYETFRRIAGFPGGWPMVIAAVLNSLLWGAAVASVVIVLRRRKQTTDR
jgi:hypothetical protein